MAHRWTWLCGIAWFASMGPALFGCGSPAPSGGASNGGAAGAGASNGGATGAGASNGGATGAGAPNGGSSGGGAATDGGSPDAMAFCRRWVDEFEAHLRTCGCDASVIQEYRTQSATACEPSGYLAVLSGAGSGLVYHPDAADALFARLRAKSPLCFAEPFRALALDSLEVFSLAGIFTGTRELGSACAHPVNFKGGVNDCREGLCAPDATGKAGVCIALARVGEECDAAGDHNLVAATKRLCFDQRPPDVDGEYESAFDSLSCVPSAPGATKHVCARDLPDGAACNSDEACHSGRCLGTGVPHVAYCAAKLADGAPCDGSEQCDHGACQNTVPRVCGPLLADGEACDYSDAACASGSCDDPAGTGGVCGPQGTRPIGETCTSPLDCASSAQGSHGNKVCNGGRCIAEICASYLS